MSVHNLYLITSPVESAPVTGASNLLESYDLNNAYNKFSSRKVKQQLSSFISHLPGPVDTPASEDDSGLMALIQRPGPVMKEIKPLSGAQLTGFRLYPGPIPEQYKVPLLMETQMSKAKKHKKKKSKKRHQSGENPFPVMSGYSSSLGSVPSISGASVLSSASTLVSKTPLGAHGVTSTPGNLTPNTNYDALSVSATAGGSLNGTPDPKKNHRKRVYDERKKKKEKKKKRKKEVLSD